MSEATEKAIVPPANLKPKKYMVFHLAGLRYAAPLASIREVLALSTLTPVPGMPVYFKGLINLRGKIISTLDLKLRLGIKDEKNAVKARRPTVIVTQVGDEPIGLIVDDVYEVVAFFENQIERKIENLEESIRQGVVGAARMDHKELTLILDLAQLGHAVGIRAA